MITDTLVTDVYEFEEIIGKFVDCKQFISPPWS